MVMCTTVLHGGVCHRTSTPHKSGNKMKKKYKIKEMLSCPEVFFGFRFVMIMFVCSSSIGVKLNTVLSLFMFKMRAET